EPSYFATGQGYCFYPRIDNQLFNLIGLDKQRLKNSLVESCATEKLLNRQRALRNVGRVFENPDVAGHYSGRGESEHLPERKIPRHDRQNRPHRLIVNITATRVRLRGFIFQKTFGVLGVVATPACALFDFLD